MQATAHRAHADEREGRAAVSTPVAWHALDTDEVGAALEVDPDVGLLEDQIVERTGRFGPNELAVSEPRSQLDILLSQFTSPLILILVVALGVTLLIDHRTDAAVIAVTLLINAVIGYTQERKADRAVTALTELAAPRSVVVRGRREREVASSELVPGDVVLLTSGTRVPADVRLVRTISLEVDESLLTGESAPARKSTMAVAAQTPTADRSGMAYMGSVVATGRGRGIVVATAAATQLGTIAESIREEERPKTPLQQRMHRFANIIAVVVIASTLVTFALGLALGEPLDQMFLTAVALAVAVVPEGLPIAYTVAMALGVHRMAKRRAIIRALPAVETLGSTNTIGSDKTGTLTTNRMTVLRGWTAEDGAVSFPGPTSDDDDVSGVVGYLDFRPGGALASALRTGVLSSEAELVIEDGRVVDRRGDPTETALLDAAQRAGLEPDRTRREASVLATVPFEPELRYSYVVVDEDGPVLRLKGAPERVLELCTLVRGPDGPVAIDLDEASDAADAMAERGLRVLAMAERRLDGPASAISADTPPQPDDLTLTGLIGMQDPPRPGVADAIDRCRSAGTRAVMITGDHAATAGAIARDLGMSEHARVLTGVDLERMSDDQLRDAVVEVDVFARVAPAHKLRVVRALQSHDQVVAVTGDGVNDGPALKAADIGVAMGRSGTDVAREASDMVLTDDDFVSIVDAVEEGRVVFDNVRKVTYYLLSTGVATIVAIMASIAAGLPLPYVPAALLWMNLATSGVQDVALAFDRGEPDVLSQPPRRREEGVVSRVLWERTVLTGLTMAAGSLWLFTWAIDAGLSLAQQRGAALTTLVVAMAAHVYNSRSERRSIFATGVRGNPLLLLSSIVALTAHVAVSSWGPGQRVLQIEPVTAPGWPRVMVVAVAVIGVSEVHKLVRSRRPAGGWACPCRSSRSSRRHPSARRWPMRAHGWSRETCSR